MLKINFISERSEKYSVVTGEEVAGIQIKVRFVLEKVWQGLSHSYGAI